MRSLTRNLVVAILTFLVGTVATISLRTLRRVPSAPVRIQDSTPEYRVETPPLPRRAGAAGKAVTKDGTPASFTSFATNDGAWLSQWSEFHDSPRGARRALADALKHATRVIRREPLLDASGHPIGEKVVATFSGRYAYYSTASLLWTDGSTFRFVAGPSLQDILDYDSGSLP